MYGALSREMDAPALTCRYVDQVERVPFSVRLSDLALRVRRMNTWVMDAIITTPFLLVGTIVMLVGDTTGGFREPGAVAVALTWAAILPYYFRRRAPLPVLVVSTVALMTLVVRDYDSNVCAQIVLVGTYTVAAYGNARERALGALTIAGALILLGIVGTPDFNGADYIMNIAVFTAAFFFGSTVRNRRLYMESLEERAKALERERDEEAKRAVADERLRIAQELHDVVAHSMGVIAVQAGVGAHVCDQDPSEAKKALENIANVSRSTLTEIRRMLGVLREDDGAEYTPAPGLGDLERLVREVCAAGVDTHVTWEGKRTELPPGVDLTAYRVIQESLTNVLKNAGPGPHVDVALRYEPDVLRIEVVDDGRGVNGRSNGGGHGLMGMRERVGVYGGSFEAGPHAGGGFRVAVSLPYGTAE
jgi:signal transduction histidine kinase